MDAWFDGAGDNADGFSVMLALAKHFAKPANRPLRTLVFVASAGHHSPGINGPRGFVEANPDLGKKAALVINIEHVAQRNFSPARTEASDGYRQAIADSGEAPTYAGVTNRAPFIDNLFQQGVLRYGTNFVSEKSNVESGETPGFASTEHGTGDDHSGAAALPHDRRGRERDFDAGARTHRALPFILHHRGGQGAARADQSLAVTRPCRSVTKTRRRRSLAKRPNLRVFYEAAAEIKPVRVLHQSVVRATLALRRDPFILLFALVVTTTVVGAV